METLKLEIVTPEGKIFENSIKSVTLPGSEGEFGVLPHHASLVSLLRAGVIDIELENSEHEIVAIDWGHAKVDENKVTILVDGAVAIIGSNDSAIAKTIEDGKKLIKSMSDSELTTAAAFAKIDSVLNHRS